MKRSFILFLLTFSVFSNELKEFSNHQLVSEIARRLNLSSGLSFLEVKYFCSYTDLIVYNKNNHTIASIPVGSKTCKEQKQELATHKSPLKTWDKIAGCSDRFMRVYQLNSEKKLKEISQATFKDYEECRTEAKKINR